MDTDKIINETIGGRGRILTVKTATIEPTQTREGTVADKLILGCVSTTGQPFNIDEVLLLDKRDNLCVKGLWVSLDDNNNICESSTIAKVLNYYDAETPAKMVGLTILALPKRNNYLAIVIDNIVAEDLPW